ncbi:MAG: biotin--[acetyl-CoA-carboxylase] ligase [Pseudomonadales bacterium]|nr:biotin--[acetyl-CoA-carboxylase] ligase [Pseudomonadales bacterium]
MDFLELNLLFAQIVEEGAIEMSAWPDEISFEHFALASEAGRLSWRRKIELYQLEAITNALRLDKLQSYYVVGSTSTEMMRVAGTQSVHQQLYIAECQVQGRGRRGRTWASPFARNLAFSYGHRFNIPMSMLGGLSLVVGLAVAESLGTITEAHVHVKWPNDVVVGEQKLCGILVELAQNGNVVEAVIGIGVNVDLDHADRVDIDRDVTDLRTLGISSSRTEVLISVVRSLQRFLARFDEVGFEPFIDAFNETHIYHGKSCVIHQGDRIIRGQVEGVDVDGALILSTDTGLRTFHGGEVSLRGS